MNGTDGKAIHAELTLRDTTLMLGPEIPQMGSRSAKTIGASPASLYLLTENADKVVAKAVKLGAAPKGPVMDMFWGDRCGTVVDPQGYTWMLATHIAEPTPQEMKKKMKEQMASQPVSQRKDACDHHENKTEDHAREVKIVARAGPLAQRIDGHRCKASATSPPAENCL